jgi:HAE1 family hydrophobic/amphiphilic exporter-1
LFVIFQSLQEKVSPIKFEGEEEEIITPELEQYAQELSKVEPEEKND